MKLLDIDLIASKEYKKSDNEMTNNLHIHITMLKRVNLQLGNHKDLPLTDHKTCSIYIGK